MMHAVYVSPAPPDTKRVVDRQPRAGNDQAQMSKLSSIVKSELFPHYVIVCDFKYAIWQSDNRTNNLITTTQYRITIIIQKCSNNNTTRQGAHDICSVRVQRAWRGHFARKNVLGNSAFVFRDLIRLASVLSRHDWRVHKMPPLRFLEFVVFSRVPCRA
jgi:hypothetical protein